MSGGDGDDRERWWDARLAALEKLYGASDGTVGHAPVPFSFGRDVGGAADVVYFRSHVEGVLAVTAELIGSEEQVESSLGNYELAICHRGQQAWGPNLISRLAYYTLQTALEPGQTMDIGSAVPEGSNISALLFCEYGQFHVDGRKAGVLLCLGITAEELKACRAGRTSEVLQALKVKNVFPFTAFKRHAVV